MPDAARTDASFGRSRRIGQPADYAAVLREGAVLRSRHFVLKHFSNGSTGARLGLVVARRLVKRAVDRNRVKRIARESFRNAHARLPSVDMVLRLCAPFDTFDGRALRGELDSLLVRVPR